MPTSRSDGGAEGRDDGVSSITSGLVTISGRRTVERENSNRLRVGACGCVVGCSRSRRREISAASSAPRTSTGVVRCTGLTTIGRRPAVDAAANHATSAAPTTANASTRFNVIASTADRNMPTSRLCYYSPCTLNRPRSRSIHHSPSKSSLSSPLDSALLVFPASRSPIWTAVR